jgi:hypothetical protein
MRFHLFAIVGLTALAASIGQADDSSSVSASQVVTQAPPAQNVSSATVNTSGRSDIFDNLYADLFSTYHGPVLDKLGSTSETVNNKGIYGPRNPMYFDSELTTAYLIDKDSMIGVGPDIPFYLTPVDGQGLTLGDVGVKAFNKKFVNTGNLRISANVYFQMPTSQYSSNVRRINYEFKTTPNWWYHFSGTRWTIGSWNEAKNYSGAADYTYKLYAEPYVNYQLTPKFAANVAYEMEWHHLDGTGTLNFTTYETDLQPGFVYMITPRVVVNPYVQLFTGNRVNSDTAALCAVITARLI